MKRKPFAAVAAATLAALLMLSGCAEQNNQPSQSQNPPDGQETGDMLERIRQSGEIIIATEGTWAPWTYHDEDDQLVGYDVEVARLIAQELGVEAVFAEGEWDGLLAGLEAGRYNIMANGVEVTDERAGQYDFSTPYAYIRTAIIVAGDNQDIDSFEDLSGKTTANTLASTYAELAESYGATPTGVDDLNQTIELLLAGRVDATLNAEVTFYDYMKAHPDSNLKIAALTQEASKVAIPMPKGEDSDSLGQAIDEILTRLSQDGTLTELSEKYFGSDISQGE